MQPEMRSSIATLLKPGPACLWLGKIQLVKRDGMIGRVPIGIKAMRSRCSYISLMSQLLENGLTELSGSGLILCPMRRRNALLLQGSLDGLDEHHGSIVG